MKVARVFQLIAEYIFVILELHISQSFVVDFSKAFNILYEAQSLYLLDY